MLDLRLLRLAFQSEPVSRIMNQVMPWALPGFGIMFLTGLLLFFAQAESVYNNSYFRIKVLMLLLLGVNAAVYQYKLWMAVIVAGRLTAYEL
jgi:hypothetical protein